MWTKAREDGGLTQQASPVKKNIWKRLKKKLSTKEVGGD